MLHFVPGSTVPVASALDFPPGPPDRKCIILTLKGKPAIIIYIILIVENSTLPGFCRDPLSSNGSETLEKKRKSIRHFKLSCAENKFEVLNFRP